MSVPDPKQICKTVYPDLKTRTDGCRCPLPDCGPYRYEHAPNLTARRIPTPPDRSDWNPDAYSYQDWYGKQVSAHKYCWQSDVWHCRLHSQTEQNRSDRSEGRYCG